MTCRATTRAVLLATLLLATERTAASSLVDFARCLTRAGATFYTAAWCPQCARQDRLFGNAARYLRTVDCTDGCDDVTSFPTWTFRDGSRISGFASLEKLAERTRCSLDEPDEEEPFDVGPDRTKAGVGTRERNVGGALIIDIPRR